jgi:hypothetical protein
VSAAESQALSNLQDQSKRFPNWGCLLALAICLFLAYRLYLYFNPYDEVTVSVSDVPPGTKFLCLVADTPQGAVAMPWLLRKAGPFTMHPDRCVVSYFYNEDKPHFRAEVQWISSSRVGVLRRTKEDKWFVAWFDEPKSHLQNRSLLLGGGEWAVSLNEADKVQPLTQEQLRALGMASSLKNE